MDKYIKDLAFIIRNGDMQNTYKAAWARAIVESCTLNPELSRIHFDELAIKIFGYYWNQAIFFQLEQCPNPNKKPEIQQIVVEEIDKYQEVYGHKPEWFSAIDHRIDVPVSKISATLSKDVCWRFQKVRNEYYEIYELDIKNKTIAIRHPDLIKEYDDALFDLINYRWTQKLEEFNHVPRVSKKVLGTYREDVKRGNLNKFRTYLDIENPNRECFFTGKRLLDSELSIDHVLPWSFLYSDDLWNLVYAEKAVNSAKSNTVPTEAQIEKLERRNKRLLELAMASDLDDKHTQELDLSVKRDTVRKFWVGCRG